MLSKEEQKKKVEQAKSKAAAKAEVHGKAVNKALITAGQKTQLVVVTSAKYVKDAVKHSVTDQRKADA